MESSMGSRDSFQRRSLAEIPTFCILCWTATVLAGVHVASVADCLPVVTSSLGPPCVNTETSFDRDDDGRLDSGDDAVDSALFISFTGRGLWSFRRTIVSKFVFMSPRKVK